MKMPKSKLGFLLAGVHVFIAIVIYYFEFECRLDLFYCLRIGIAAVLPFSLLVSLLAMFADIFRYFSLFQVYFFSVFVNSILFYFIGSFIQRKFSSKITRAVIIGVIIIAIAILGILGIRYFNKSDMKPNFSTNVNNPVNSGNYCQQDSDCVLAPQYQGCCPDTCNNKEEAVNVETKNMDGEARNKQYNCHLKNIVCPSDDCLLSGNKQAVCEQNRCVVKEKQTAVDATNYKIIGSFTSPGESSFVKVLGTTAYLTDISEGLLAIDVSNPEKPTLLSKIKIGNGGAYALAVSFAGSYAVVSGYGNSKIALIDIRDPKNLRIIDEIDAKRPVQDMAMVANNVYLAIDGHEIEMSYIKKEPSFPFIVKEIFARKTFETQKNGHTIGMTVTQDGEKIPLLVIAEGEAGVGVYNLFMPTPQYEFSIKDVGYVNIVDADENYVYAGVGNGIKVIDLKTQKEIADIKVDDVWNFKVKNNMLYVASGENGVKVLDISDIKNPKQTALIDTPGRARSIDVSVDGKYIYVADDRDDLQIIKKD